jgi:D-lactate dehydrogenase
MRVALFSARSYDRGFFDAANALHGHDLTFFEPRLMPETASLALGFPAICLFVSDRLDRNTIVRLAPRGLALVALRSTGYNHVDVGAADRAGVHVSRVPAYSPESVAEHTVALVLALDRNIHRAHARVREGNFSLDGLLGTQLHGRTVGIVGTGRIGTATARIMAGFGCRLLAYDPVVSHEVTALGGVYVPLDRLLSRADIVTLHCPLTPGTRHLINRRAVEMMKPGVMLINTGRGGLIDTPAVIDGLKSGRIGHLGLDTYEEEEGLFFEDLSDTVIRDDVFARLLTFPNVLVTGHQGFFTRQALEAIAETTLTNITAFEKGDLCLNAVTDQGRRYCEELAA